jgi:hypothetical protein
MSPDISNTALIAKCVLIALITVFVLVRYAREIKCEDCQDGVYAIWTRADRQVCSSCRDEYDYLCRGKKRPRPQIWKPAVSRWEWIRRTLT